MAKVKNLGLLLMMGSLAATSVHAENLFDKAEQMVNAQISVDSLDVGDDETADANSSATFINKVKDSARQNVERVKAFIDNNEKVVWVAATAAILAAASKINNVGKQNAAIQNLVNPKLVKRRQDILKQLENAELTTAERTVLYQRLSVVESRMVAEYFADKNCLQTLGEVLKAALPL